MSAVEVLTHRALAATVTAGQCTTAIAQLNLARDNAISGNLGPAVVHQICVAIDTLTRVIAQTERTRKRLLRKADRKALADKGMGE